MMSLADGSNVRIGTQDAVTSMPIIHCNITICANVMYVMHTNVKYLSSTEVNILPIYFSFMLLDSLTLLNLNHSFLLMDLLGCIVIK